MPPETEPQATPPEQTSTPSAPTPAQQRINELYGQKMQAQEQAAAFEVQNAELRSQLASLQEEVTSLKSQRPAPSTDDPFASPAVPPSGIDVEQVASKAAEQAVGSIVAKWEQERQVDQLRAAQTTSFQRAVQQYPALGDPQSELNQTAREILSRDRHLQAHPDGPYLAAAVAQGLMAPSQLVATPEQKLAATQVPTGAGLPEAEQKADTPEAIEKKMVAIMDQIRKGEALDGANRPMSDTEQRDLYMEYRKLQQQLPPSKME